MLDWSSPHQAPKGFRCQSLWAKGKVIVLGGVEVSVRAGPALPHRRVGQKTASIVQRQPMSSSWHVAFHGPCEITHLAGSEDFLFALGLDFDGDGRDRSYLVRSETAGRSFEVIDMPEMEAFQLARGLAFASPETGYVWSEDAVVMTSDRGARWSISKDYESLAGSLILASEASEGVLWLVTQEHLLLVDASGRVVAEPLPRDVHLDALSYDGGTLWAAGRSKTAQNTRVLQRVIAGVWKELATTPRCLPYRLYRRGSRAFLFATDVARTPPRYVMLQCRDGGATWEGEVTPELSSTTVSADGVVWGCSPVGRIARAVLES